MRRENESIFTLKMAFLECLKLIFYHKQSKVLFCLQEKGVAQSVLVLDIIRNVSRLGSLVNLQVHFKLLLVFYFLQYEEFFLKKFKMNQTEVAPNMKVFLHNVPACTKEHHIG